MNVAPCYTLLTLFILFKLLYNGYTVAGMPIYMQDLVRDTPLDHICSAQVCIFCQICIFGRVFGLLEHLWCQKMKNLDLNCLSFGMHFLQVDLTLLPLTLSNSYHSRQVCNHSELGV